MQTRSRLFDDLARLASSAAGLANGLRDEIDSVVRDQLSRAIDRMDLVHRDEFEVVRDMAERARLENEQLNERIDALETKLAQVSGATDQSS